ncbi:Zn-dependent protease with chaperone function [Melghiribacillus thermohalophilus]|uniref:Zn-dependent protease with chaperone function n=1 Tax=Melghiribacillus thermohalophilus TaxID=1324956 RepID=A0A4V2V105_9BACI|nr:M48 family metallopeptidase [Melghiribacillus thermohalophilus]TCT19342.1 Zn-dependent protease with chaperone function [Melghiribacillus thermohalophilus]
MTEQKYLELIQTFEVQYAQDPQKYRKRLGHFALFGYAYIWLWILVATGLAVASIYVIIFIKGHYGYFKLLFLSLLFLFIVLRAVTFRIKPPGGLEIKKDQAPLLFDMLEDIKKKIQSPKIHKVLITSDFNAAISQVPRLGMFGFHKNYLIIGLPLMHALTADQFKSVIGHELGHLSRKHGKFSSWIYRVRESWLKVIDVLEHKKTYGLWIYKKFFNWFFPRFNAYSFVIRRENEYEADQQAAIVTDSKTGIHWCASVWLAAG